MPTRDTGASKPSTYTFSASGVWANTLAGHIFSDESGGSVPDITGNGNALTLNGTASVVSSDALHGLCLSPGTQGASLVPPASWNALSGYTQIILLRVDTDGNQSGTTEGLVTLTDSSAGNSFATTWLTSNNVSTNYNDDTNSDNNTITDGIQNNAGQWVTVANVVDPVNTLTRLYIIVDGEATQVAENTSSTITGSSTNDFYSVGVRQTLTGPYHGLVEANYFIGEALTQTQIEDIHTNPYSWDASFSLSGDIQVSVIPEASFGFTTPAHYSISSNISTSVIPEATFSFLSTPPVYSLSGDVQVGIGINATMQYQQQFSITGDITLAVIPSANITFTDGPQAHEIVGDITLSLTPNATIRYSSPITEHGGTVISSWSNTRGNRSRIMAEDKDLLAFIKGNMSAFMRGRK